MKKTKSVFMLSMAIVIIASCFILVNAVEDSVDVGDYDITYSYSSAKADKRFNLEIQIENLDSTTKENVSIEFDFKSPLDEVNDDFFYFGTMTPGEIRSHSFRVEVDDDANSGKEHVDFEIKDSNDSYEDEIEIKIVTDEAEIDYTEIESFPSRIVANQDQIKFVVTLQNEGDNDIEKVKSRLVLPKGFEFSNSYSDVDNLGTIKAGEQVKAEFYFDTNKNLVAKTYEAQIELTYENDDDEETKIIDIEIPVKSTPQFSISEVKTEGKVYAGQETIVKIKLLNFGEEIGKETSIKVFEKSEHPFEFSEKSSSIGLVKPNEEGIAILKFKTDKDATLGEYIIDFQIRTINSGDVLVFEDSFKVNVYKKETSPVGLIIMGLIAISVLGGVFLYQKKKKK